MPEILSTLEMDFDETKIHVLLILQKKVHFLNVCIFSQIFSEQKGERIPHCKLTLSLRVMLVPMRNEICMRPLSIEI